MGVHGYASAERPPDADPAGSSSSSDKRICLAVVTELCPHGNLEDFMAAEGAPLSAAVKLDVMLQVAQGLDQLKEARIVWRDLKAKNLLVRAAHRGRTAPVRPRSATAPRLQRPSRPPISAAHPSALARRTSSRF